MSIETEAAVLWDDFTGFWSNTVWPGLKNLLKVAATTEVTVLAPIAEQVVSTIEADLKGVTSLSGAAVVIGGVFSAVAKQAEEASISAEASALVAAVSSALGNLFSASVAVPASTPATPASPPAAI